MDVYELTEKGKDKWLILDKKGEAHVKVKGPSDILFSLDPKERWMTVHVITYDPDFIKIILAEVAKINKDLGRPARELYFKGDPIFKDVGNAVFAVIMAYLKLKGQRVPEEVEKKALEVVEQVPFLFPFLESILNKKG